VARTRSPNPSREEAFKIYEEHKGKITNREIAKILNESSSNIASWKKRDKWDEQVINKGGAPKGNLNNFKHGIYCDETKRLPEQFIKKYFPTGLKNAYEDTTNLAINEMDKLKHSIDFLWNMILVTPKITNVKNKNDMTKELKREKNSWGDKSSSEEKEYEIQFAWDKQNNNLDTYSKALERLGNLIEKYEKLIHANWDLVAEEEKLRIEKLKADIAKVQNTSDDDKPIEILIKRKGEDK
jgi:uncharacterized protein YjcR